MTPKTLPENTHCKNCGTELHGTFCHNCGQEDKERKEDFRALAKESIEDLTFFNSKIWGTLKLLILNPAKLSRSFLDGKRASIVAPFKLYLFLAMIFSFIDYSFSDTDFVKIGSNDNVTAEVVESTDSVNQHRSSLNFNMEDNKTWIGKRLNGIEHKYKNNPKALSEDFTSKLSNKYPLFTLFFHSNYCTITFAFIQPKTTIFLC